MALFEIKTNTHTHLQDGDFPLSLCPTGLLPAGDVVRTVTGPHRCCDVTMASEPEPAGTALSRNAGRKSKTNAKPVKSLQSMDDGYNFVLEH